MDDPDPTKLEYENPRDARDRRLERAKQFVAIAGLVMFPIAVGAFGLSVWLNQNYDSGPRYELTFVSLVCLATGICSIAAAALTAFIRNRPRNP